MNLIKSSLVISFIALSGHTFTQTPSKKIPPIEQLPKVGESKKFFELPEITDYKVYNQLGKEVLKGRAEFIDVTDLAEGAYFIKYSGKTVSYVVE